MEMPAARGEVEGPDARVRQGLFSRLPVGWLSSGGAKVLLSDATDPGAASGSGRYLKAPASQKMRPSIALDGMRSPTNN